jgi:hypothetical protein
MEQPKNNPLSPREIEEWSREIRGIREVRDNPDTSKEIGADELREFILDRDRFNQERINCHPRELKNELRVKEQVGTALIEIGWVEDTLKNFPQGSKYALDLVVGAALTQPAIVLELMAGFNNGEEPLFIELQEIMNYLKEAHSILRDLRDSSFVASDKAGGQGAGNSVDVSPDLDIETALDLLGKARDVLSKDRFNPTLRK